MLIRGRNSVIVMLEVITLLTCVSLAVKRLEVLDRVDIVAVWFACCLWCIILRDSVGWSGGGGWRSSSNGGWRSGGAGWDS